MNSISANNSFSIPSRLLEQQEFLKRIRNLQEINSLVIKQKDNQISQQNSQSQKFQHKFNYHIRNSSNEELFADIEKARQNQNSSGESKNKRSQSANVRNIQLDKALNKFNDSRLLIIDFCDTQLYNDENQNNEESKQDQEKKQFLQDIQEVFNNENQITPNKQMNCKYLQ